jgi:hypothetical protein
VASTEWVPLVVATGVQYALEKFRGGFSSLTDTTMSAARQSDGAITQMIRFGDAVPTGLGVRNTIYTEAGPVPHLPEKADRPVRATRPRRMSR